MVRTLIAVAVGVSAVGLGPTSPAHADTESYLRYLWSASIEWRGVGDGQKIAAGMGACNQLRAGRPYDAVKKDTFGIFAPFSYGMPLIVHAAQHELCPDTLHTQASSPAG